MFHSVVRVCFHHKDVTTSCGTECLLIVIVTGLFESVLKRVFVQSDQVSPKSQGSLLLEPNIQEVGRRRNAQKNHLSLRGRRSAGKTYMYIFCSQEVEKRKRAPSSSQ